MLVKDICYCGVFGFVVGCCVCVMGVDIVYGVWCDFGVCYCVWNCLCSVVFGRYYDIVGIWCYCKVCDFGQDFGFVCFGVFVFFKDKNFCVFVLYYVIVVGGEWVVGVFWYDV